MTYATDFPSEHDFSERLLSTLQFWSDRNIFITRIRNMMSGSNPINAPKASQYKVRVIHTYLMAATVNEKAARFVQQPLIQAIPNNIDDDELVQSSQLENALSAAFYEMERNGDGDVWSRVVLDAIMLDEGVERIERAPAAFWPESLTTNDEGETVWAMEGDEFDNYKKSRGLPIRSVYIPLENIYPIYEGSVPIETFELEVRTLREINRSDSVSQEAKAKLGTMMAGTTKGLDQYVTVVRYCNLRYSGMFAIGPTQNNQWPDLMTGPYNMTSITDAVEMSRYEHGLNKVIYNFVGGRFGGWKGPHNRIEPVNKGLMELNQAADEIASQVITNIRAKNWPNLIALYDPDHRESIAGAPPKAPTVQEGESISMYIGESLQPIFKPADDPMVQWAFSMLQEQIGRLGGSPVLFGDRSPGVETGYHQSLQITQAEHLDDKVEQHLASGAIQRATLLLEHVIALGEKVPVHYMTTDSQGRRKGIYLYLDPTKLNPMPRFDAQVRKPRPVDFAAALRTAREASDEREGKGPLMPDRVILSELLNRTQPDEDKRLIRTEKEQNRLIESGVLADKIAEQLNLKLATEGVDELAPEEVASADPTLLAAMQKINADQAPNAGGVTPERIVDQGRGSTHLATGMPTGQSQPEQAVGQEIAGAQ
jgi:hypothetical protein